MPFNTDWNPTQPPFVAGIAILTHEEVLYVKGHCERIISEYVQEYPWSDPIPSNDYVISTYNTIDGWKKAINGDTYTVIMSYDPEIHTLGINETGIILPKTPTDQTSEGTTPDTVETTENAETGE